MDVQSKAAGYAYSRLARPPRRDASPSGVRNRASGCCAAWSWHAKARDRWLLAALAFLVVPFGTIDPAGAWLTGGHFRH